MNSHPGPVEIECDAPPYAVVQACACLGFRNPLDVRWRHARELAGRGPRGLGRGLWKALLGRGGQSSYQRMVAQRGHWPRTYSTSVPQLRVNS